MKELPLSSNRTDSCVLKNLSYDPTLSTLTKGSKSPTHFVPEAESFGECQTACVCALAPGHRAAASHESRRLSGPPPSRCETGLTTTTLGPGGRSEFCVMRVQVHGTRDPAPAGRCARLPRLVSVYYSKKHLWSYLPAYWLPYSFQSAEASAELSSLNTKH